MDKYDKILSQLLTKFYMDTAEEEETRRIVKEVINAEISKLDKGRPWGVLQEIHSIIGKEAELKVKRKRK